MLLRSILGSAALLVLFARCQPAPPPTKAPEAVLAAAPSAGPPAAPLAALDAGGDTEGDAGQASGPAPPLPTESDPTLVGCGARRCKVGSETCCLFSDESECVASVPPGPNDHVQLLASQLEACGATRHTYSLTEVRRCDESSDCARGEVCCGMFLYGGASADICVPFKTPGRAPCDFSEVCIDDAGCRTAGSKCIEGVCRRPVTLSCARQRCTGEKNACCGDPPACSAPADCTPGQPRYRCASPKDCLPGEHCQMHVMGSVCSNFLDVANTRKVCDKTVDCGPSDALCQRYVCKPSEISGIKACECAP